MTPTQLALPLLLLAAGGCSTLDSGVTNCSQDWYDAGFRDGRFIGQRRDMQYAASCDRSFDPARYTSGWEDGVTARPAQPGA